MKEVNKVDLGSVKVHKRVLAEIVQAAIAEIKGVSLIPGDFLTNLSEILGAKKYPGVAIGVDKNNQVSVEVRICIAYGLNIPDVAKQVQDVVREAIERTADIDLKDINVSVQGIAKPGTS